jgi:hypothetical protein
MSLERLIIGDTEKIDSNTLEYAMDDTISRGISFVGNLPSKLLFFSKDIGNYPRKEVQNHVRKYVVNSNLRNITVRLGHSRVIKDIKRLFKDDKLKDISKIGKILFGIPTTLIGGIGAKLSRSDWYNPFTRTAHIYSDVKAVAGHELGHAEDFQNKKYVSLYSLVRRLSPVMLYQEYIASKKSHDNLSEKDKWQTGRYLFPAFGTYVAASAGAFTLLGGLGIIPTLSIMGASYILGNLYIDSKKEEKRLLNQSK